MLATETAATAAHRTSIHTLDTLAARSLDELAALYRAARCPTSMRAADGALVGRMLAMRGVPAPIARRLRAWAAAPSFVWEGKSFHASGDARGDGYNRVSIPRVLGKQRLFPFATSFGPSAIDGAPTLVLDYELAVNPPYIQRIHDEIREVSPGLFLGPAMWKSRERKTLVLWFALDSRLS